MSDDEEIVALSEDGAAIEHIEVESLATVGAESIPVEEPERVEEEATPPPVKRRKKKRSKKSSVIKTSASKSRSIRSIYPGVVIASQGMPSGASYRWDQPGAIVQVAADDVDAVMAKNGSGARECCGSSSLPVYFEFAD